MKYFIPIIPTFVAIRSQWLKEPYEENMINENSSIKGKKNEVGSKEGNTWKTRKWNTTNISQDGCSNTTPSKYFKGY